jgi:AraC family transcriptional regulator
MTQIPFTAVSDALKQLMPCQPTLTSEQAGLHNILLTHYHHHAWEVPEHSSPFPVLEMITAPPTAVPHSRRMGDYTQSATLVGGEIFVCPPSADYYVEWDRDLEFTLIGFQPRLFAEAMEGQSCELPPLAMHADLTIQTIVRNIRQDLADGCPLGSIYSDSAALYLTIHLLKLWKTKPPTVQEDDRLASPSLKKVLDYLYEHYTDSKAVRLEALAEIANITQFHFHRLFKQSTGKTPKQYVLGLRIDRAKYLLRHTNQTLPQIAIACGFTRSSELNKWFTKLVGTPPEQFRQRAQ